MYELREARHLSATATGGAGMRRLSIFIAHNETSLSTQSIREKYSPQKHAHKPSATGKGKAHARIDAIGDGDTRPDHHEVV